MVLYIWHGFFSVHTLPAFSYGGNEANLSLGITGRHADIPCGYGGRDILFFQYGVCFYSRGRTYSIPVGASDACSPWLTGRPGAGRSIFEVTASHHRPGKHSPCTHTAAAGTAGSADVHILRVVFCAPAPRAGAGCPHAIGEHPLTQEDFL